MSDEKDVISAEASKGDEMDGTKKPEEIVKSVESVESSLPELPETELNQVVGGRPCATGTHYDEPTLVIAR